VKATGLIAAVPCVRLNLDIEDLSIREAQELHVTDTECRLSGCGGPARGR